MMLKRYEINRVGAFAATALAAATLAAPPASAAVTSIKTSSTILDVALTAFGFPVKFGPELPASGSAPPAYNINNSLASFSDSVSTPLGELSFSTGALEDTASGDTTTAVGTASSSLASFDIALGSVATVTATALGSTSSVDGTPSAAGSSTLLDLTITILGSSLIIPLKPPANDLIFDLGGVTITLNQQIQEIGGEGVDEGITTNAVAISFADSPELSGHIDIAQSMASIKEAAVPEISTWAMMAFGFAGLAFASWRARKLTSFG